MLVVTLDLDKNLCTLASGQHHHSHNTFRIDFITLFIDEHIACKLA